MNATSATPLVRLPVAGSSRSRAGCPPPSCDSRAGRTSRCATCSRPVYGPTPAAWAHCPTVELVPPVPPSARYRSPSGPNLSPRGLFRPVANVSTVAGAVHRGEAALDPGDPQRRWLGAGRLPSGRRTLRGPAVTPRPPRPSASSRIPPQEGCSRAAPVLATGPIAGVGWRWLRACKVKPDRRGLVAAASQRPRGPRPPLATEHPQRRIRASPKHEKAATDGMFRLRVLGGFALEGPSGVSTPAAQRRGEAVLAVLAVYGDLGCTRERLIALLWPESDEKPSPGTACATPSAPSAMRSGPTASCPSANCCASIPPSSSPTSFRSRSRCAPTSPRTPSGRTVGGCSRASTWTARRSSSDGWTVSARRLAREYAEALERLATAAERAGAWTEAVGWWARAVEHDPLNSHFVLRHVQAMAAIGDRANALRVADAHARRLREELDLEPDRDVVAEIERIRRGEMPAPRGGRATPRARRRTGGPAGDGRRVTRAPRARHAPAWDRGQPPSAAGAGGPAGGRGRRASPPSSCSPGPFGVGRWLRARAAATRHPRTAIAVLPFQNLSADSPHAVLRRRPARRAADPARQGRRRSRSSAARRSAGTSRRRSRCARSPTSWRSGASSRAACRSWGTGCA